MRLDASDEKKSAERACCPPPISAPWPDAPAMSCRRGLGSVVPGRRRLPPGLAGVRAAANATFHSPHAPTLSQSPPTAVR